jgi:hypothetical protein
MWDGFLGDAPAQIGNLKATRDRHLAIIAILPCLRIYEFAAEFELRQHYRGAFHVFLQ